MFLGVIPVQHRIERMPIVNEPPKLVYFIGCCHELQYYRGDWDDLPYLRPGSRWDAKIASFEETIRTVIAKYQFNLFCEEARHSKPNVSILQRIAGELGLTYRNIDAPPSFRCEHKIRPIRSDPQIYEGLGEEIPTPEEIERWCRLREDYMFNAATEGMTRKTCALIICGQDHVSGLDRRFRDWASSIPIESVDLYQSLCT